MTDNQRTVTERRSWSAPPSLFGVTALVGPFWLAVVVAGVAAGLATFAVGRIGRHEAER